MMVGNVTTTIDYSDTRIRNGQVGEPRRHLKANQRLHGRHVLEGNEASFEQFLQK